MTVLDATRAELEAMGVKVHESALAATAVVLAATLDEDSSATSKAYLAKSLADVMRDIRSLAPPKQENDQLDDLDARRKARLAGVAASARSASS